MAKKAAYQADFHVILVVYLASGKCLSAPDLAQMWRLLSVFGTERVEAGMTSVGQSEPHRVNTVLGDVAVKECLLGLSSPLVHFGASVVRPDARNAVLDSDINLSYRSESAWNGEHAPAEVTLSVSEQTAKHLDESTLLGLFRDLLQLLEPMGPPYGLVDLAVPADAFAGMIYGTAWPATAPIQRWTEQHAWVSSAARKRDRARGLYWGNYFGPDILTRLGGRAHFLNRYRHQARNFDRAPNAHIWEFAQGVFVSLSLSPFQYAPGQPLLGVDRNLLWLHNELGTKGVLNPW